MKIIIGICFIILLCSARGDNEVCRANGPGLNISDKPTTIITHIRRDDPSLYNDQKNLLMFFDHDTIISPNAFSSLNLKSVSFEMPRTTERNKSALHTLTLYPNSFVGLLNSSTIQITYADIILCGRTLTSIENLDTFYFISCGFCEVPTEMLESTPNLVTLSLERNYIAIIRRNAFLLLKSLKYLYLQNNGIISLELGCFNGLDNLETLYISDNHFTRVQYCICIFGGLTKLRYLDIQNVSDDIDFIRDILQNKPALHSLEMGRNNIMSLMPNMFDTVPQLVILSLSQNQITHVPKGVFDKLKSLEQVYLGSNHIKTIESGAFSGVNMYSLDLSLNEGDKIIETGTFSNPITAQLNLRSSNIIQLKPRAFYGLSTGFLDLSGNKLKQIGAQDFFGLDAGKLDLSDNEIKTIAPNAFKNTKVELLHLTGNPINMKDKKNWGLPESTKVVMETQDEILKRLMFPSWQELYITKG